MLTFFLLLLGFVFLIKGAELLVYGASSIALRLNVSSLVIGLTVVAFGTSAPELFISVYAAVNGNPEIAISNILGSNMANIFLILGITAMMSPLIFQHNTTFKEIPFSLLAVLVLGLLVNDTWINKGDMNMISRMDGLILLFFFIFFFLYIIDVARNGNHQKTEKVQYISWFRSVLFVCLGLAGLILGGQWIVDGAVVIAANFQVSQSLIGLTIVAIGTSLPELATTIAAARKNNVDMAIGNVIGSNIFNVLLILGITATVRPVPFPSTSYSDLIITMLSSFLLFVFVYSGNRHVLQRWHGGLFIIIYISYILYKIYQG